MLLNETTSELITDFEWENETQRHHSSEPNTILPGNV